jgi:bacterial/archaeal transporter family protein
MPSTPFDLLAPAFAVAVMWGVQPIVSKSVLHKVSWQALIITGNIIFMTMLILMWVFVGGRKLTKEIQHIPGNAWAKIFAIYALLAFPAAMIYFKLLSENDAAPVVALVSAYPLVTVLLAWLVFKDTISPSMWLGALAIVIGITLISRSQIK